MMTAKPTARHPLLVVISAPSGAGKTTLCRRLLEDFRELRLSISTTTRAPRGQEQHGREYFFTTREEFEAQIRTGTFAEWALVHGNYYGTSKLVIAESLGRGESVLLDIDVQGTEILKNAFGDRCVTIFIAPPSMEELELRLRNRGTDSEESIQRRMQNARGEISQSHKFDHKLINDDLEQTYSRLHAIVSKALRGTA
jgi:guanylate kinase